MKLREREEDDFISLASSSSAPHETQKNAIETSETDQSGENSEVTETLQADEKMVEAKEASEGKGITSAEMVGKKALGDGKSREVWHFVMGRLEEEIGASLFCLYGINLFGRADVWSPEGIFSHPQTRKEETVKGQEECAELLRFLLPFLRQCKRERLKRFSPVLRKILGFFPLPPPSATLKLQKIEALLDCPAQEDDAINALIRDVLKPSPPEVSEFSDVYRNIYFLVTESEDLSVADVAPSVLFSDNGADLVQQNASLFKFDLCFNESRCTSWRRLAEVYDEEADLLLNDGSKQMSSEEWRQKRKNLGRRVAESRARTRRALLAALHTAQDDETRREVRELLGLVHYDALQSTAPDFDQRKVNQPRDDTWRWHCRAAAEQFSAAHDLRPDWTHRFYLGKLALKLGFPLAHALDHFQSAVNMFQHGVEPRYRLHATRAKALTQHSGSTGTAPLDSLQTLANFCFSPENKERCQTLIAKVLMADAQNAPNEESQKKETVENGNNVASEQYPIVSGRSNQLREEVGVKSQEEEEEGIRGEIWNVLFDDSVAALRSCLEGDLKHFHKARHRLAVSLLSRSGLKQEEQRQKAKEELEFFFRHLKSGFAVNVWEIDYLRGKGRRRSQRSSFPGPSAGRERSLEVGMREVSRKFITCVRKYLLLYVDLAHQSGDIAVLGNVYHGIKKDAKYSNSLKDISLLSLGLYLQSLMARVASRKLPRSPHAPPPSSKTFVDSPSGQSGQHLGDLKALFEMYLLEHLGGAHVGEALSEASDGKEAERERLLLEFETHAFSYLDALADAGQLAGFHWAMALIKRQKARAPRSSLPSLDSLLQSALATWQTALSRALKEAASQAMPGGASSLDGGSLDIPAVGDAGGKDDSADISRPESQAATFVLGEKDKQTTEIITLTEEEEEGGAEEGKEGPRTDEVGGSQKFPVTPEVLAALALKSAAETEKLLRQKRKLEVGKEVLDSVRILARELASERGDRDENITVSSSFIPGGREKVEGIFLEAFEWVHGRKADRRDFENLTAETMKKMARSRAVEGGNIPGNPLKKLQNLKPKTHSGALKRKDQFWEEVQSPANGTASENPAPSAAIPVATPGAPAASLKKKKKNIAFEASRTPALLNLAPEKATGKDKTAALVVPAISEPKEMESGENLWILALSSAAAPLKNPESHSSLSTKAAPKSKKLEELTCEATSPNELQVPSAPRGILKRKRSSLWGQRKVGNLWVELSPNEGSKGDVSGGESSKNAEGVQNVASQPRLPTKLTLKSQARRKVAMEWEEKTVTQPTASTASSHTARGTYGEQVPEKEDIVDPKGEDSTLNKFGNSVVTSNQVGQK